MYKIYNNFILYYIFKKTEYKYLYIYDKIKMIKYNDEELQ